MAQIFHVIIEKDEDGIYVGKALELKGCLSQGDTLDELMINIREAIELCLEVQSNEKTKIQEENIRFVGVQEIEVWTIKLPLVSSKGTFNFIDYTERFKLINIFI